MAFFIVSCYHYRAKQNLLMQASRVHSAKIYFLRATTIFRYFKSVFGSCVTRGNFLTYKIRQPIENLIRALLYSLFLEPIKTSMAGVNPW